MIKKNLKTARENRLMYRETEISMTAALFFWKQCKLYGSGAISLIQIKKKTCQTKIHFLENISLKNEGEIEDSCTFFSIELG